MKHSVHVIAKHMIMPKSSSGSYSCKVLRSTRVAPSLFLRARSSLSSLLFDFSASRSSLVRLFTAGIKLDETWSSGKLPTRKKTVTENRFQQRGWQCTCPAMCLGLQAPWRCPLTQTSNQTRALTSSHRRGQPLEGELPGDGRLDRWETIEYTVSA